MPTTGFRTFFGICLVVTTMNGSSHAAANESPFLHGLFTDHMVLQRDRPIPVWGWTTPGANVAVTLGERQASAVADGSGRWEAVLDALPAGGPHVLEVVGPQSVTRTDVMIGDVWLCSGQSNMEMGIGAATNAQAEIAGATNSMIRLFVVPQRISADPEATLGGEWQTCSPQTVIRGVWSGFSAVGYFFGRKLQEDTGIPIGLIQAAWGGTVAEAWTSAEALRAMSDFMPALDGLAQARNRPPGGFERLLDEWWRLNDSGSASEPGWADPGLDDSAWKTMEIPQNWDNAGLAGFDGVVWFRRSFDLPKTWEGRDLVLHLGPIDDWDTTWVNGVRVGGMSRWDALRDYPIPAGIVKPGSNTIAVRVLDLQLGGGIYGTPDQVKIEVAGDRNAPPISLVGPWRYRVSVSLQQASPMPEDLLGNPNAVTVLYNGMIAPLVPFGIKGAIWYQGESNTGRARQYRTLLPAMIRDWRSRFGGDFPFLIVQVADFTDAPQDPSLAARAEIREAQLMTAQSVPNCGLAVTIDIGNPTDIHPANKQEVGRRLALNALALVYGRKIEYSGPIYKSFAREDAGIRLTFDHVGDGLVAKGGKLTGFTVAGSDKRFVSADAVIDGETIVVTSPSVADPAAVRYGWADAPTCNLYNAAGLPASPFRTDPD